MCLVVNGGAGLVPKLALFPHPRNDLPGCAPFLGLGFSTGLDESLWSIPAWHVYIFYPKLTQIQNPGSASEAFAWSALFSHFTHHVSQKDES